jgi:hypothetical protein
MSVDDLIGFTQPAPPDVSEDLAAVEGAPRRLAILGKTRHLQRLAELPGLEALWIGEVNEAQFQKIVPLIDPLYLNIHGMRVADLTPLAGLTRLQGLEITWNTKVADIAFVERLAALRLFALSHCPKVRDIGPVGSLQNLEVLDLSGGMWSTFCPRTLAPLRHLRKLRGLSLKTIRVEDQSLAPVAELKQLEYLELSNQFPTEEFARLSVALPHLDCAQLEPYVELGSDRARTRVMVTGKRKPLLTLPEDQAKLTRYVERFRELQETFRRPQ